MANAFLISILGMGLVFLGLILLWGMMALLVRLTSSDSLSVSSAIEQDLIITEPGGNNEKNMAAAIAVTTAMALQSKLSRQVQVREDWVMTPWQVAHRNYSLSQKQSLSHRKG